MFGVLLCLLLNILVHIHFGCAEEDLSNVGQYKVTELLPEIYDVYLQAVSKDENTVTRRLFKNNNKYTLHIQKLKEVNGIKTHNVVVTEFLKSDEPLVYINNPVESHTPNAFLTQEQFKMHLMNNIKQQQKDFENQKIKKVISRFKMKSKENDKHGKHFVWTVSKHSESNFNVVSPKNVITEEATLTRIPTTRSTTDNSRDLFIAMLNGEIIPDRTISTTLRNKKKPTAHTFAEASVVPSDVTTEQHVLVNTTTDNFTTVNNDTIATTDKDETSSDATTNISTDTEATSSETTANVTTDIDETSSDTDVNISIDTDEETSEATTPMTSTELISTESTSTQSTRRTRGRPFVFMGQD